MAGLQGRCTKTLKFSDFLGIFQILGSIPKKLQKIPKSYQIYLQLQVFTLEENSEPPTAPWIFFYASRSRRIFNPVLVTTPPAVFAAKSEFQKILKNWGF
jgi:hypothetical protein